MEIISLCILIYALIDPLFDLKDTIFFITYFIILNLKYLKHD